MQAAAAPHRPHDPFALGCSVDEKATADIVSVCMAVSLPIYGEELIPIQMNSPTLVVAAT